MACRVLRNILPSLDPRSTTFVLPSPTRKSTILSGPAPVAAPLSSVISLITRQIGLMLAQRNTSAAVLDAAPSITESAFWAQETDIAAGHAGDCIMLIRYLIRTPAWMEDCRIVLAQGLRDCARALAAVEVRVSREW